MKIESNGNSEFVILVDENDNELGLMEKMEAHEKGSLHRAFSIFIFNRDNELLLQQRASNKYHSPELWTNTCCSHPRFGESIEEAGERRLLEEMGLKSEMQKIFSFQYRAEIENLIEHELDHVLIGFTENEPVLNTNEVMNWKFAPVDEISRRMKSNPEEFTAWFHICFDRVKEHMKSQFRFAS